MSRFAPTVGIGREVPRPTTRQEADVSTPETTPGLIETISDHEASEALLDRLEQDIEINKRTLARKAKLLTWAYALMLLAVLAELVGKLI